MTASKDVTDERNFLLENFVTKKPLQDLLRSQGSIPRRTSRQHIISSKIKRELNLTFLPKLSKKAKTIKNMKVDIRTSSPKKIQSIFLPSSSSEDSLSALVLGSAGVIDEEDPYAAFSTPLTLPVSKNDTCHEAHSRQQTISDVFTAAVSPSPTIAPSQKESLQQAAELLLIIQNPGQGSTVAESPLKGTKKRSRGAKRSNSDLSRYRRNLKEIKSRSSRRLSPSRKRKQATISSFMKTKKTRRASSTEPYERDLPQFNSATKIAFPSTSRIWSANRQIHRE